MSKLGIGNCEGRPHLGRPSLCLLAVIAIAGLFLAPAAEATPPIPLLTGTSPPSPNTDLAPFIRGESNGIEIRSLRFSYLSAVRLASGAEPRTINLYADKFCEGTEVAAQGSSEALDTKGIQVSVKAETTTFFSATQTEGTETSGCSAPIEYKQVKELPPPTEEEKPPSEGHGKPPSEESSSNPPGGAGSARPDPPHLHTIPVGRANDTTPLVAGTAPGAASVKIFENAGCEGPPVAKGSVAQFASGLQVAVAQNTATSFSGVAVGAGGAQSACSSAVVYTEDSTPPHTRITMAPGVKTRDRSAVFRFTDTTDDPPGTTYLCKVNHGGWKPCATPLHLHRLHFRSYTVRVKATDVAGNQETVGAKRRFKVVRAP